MLERTCWNAKQIFGQIGVVNVAFIVNASRGEAAATTVRLSAVVAIAKARSLLRDGWQVFISAPDGVRYMPDEFDKLLMLDPAVRSSP
ncbi:MAG: hypothetical protein WCB02_04850 [Bradyrhizobium sp.]